MPDKYTATWVSHSSMGDFLKCPRAYYLNNVYKSPETGRKIQLMSPPLALGGAVHEIIEGLSIISTQERFKKSLIEKFNDVWRKYRGERGGFSSDEQERKYKERGEKMLRKVMNNPGPLNNLAVKINEDLPQYWLSEDDNIILCGKVDWLEYLPDEDAVHIIDFKTGKREEQNGSLQLPIYHLLVHNTQQRKVAKASYWYLDLFDEPQEQELPDLIKAHDQILEIAKKIKLARKLERFKCPGGEGGCQQCKPLEKILAGEAKKVGVNEYNQDVFVLTSVESNPEDQSTIL
ncbi:PD-(D/E)XK nuclease family protein [Patescibacteria group bacterium]|nr:PD-(D/E)XK nuclease family protein [Patescibacteria group bacterium]MBU1966883.1 PD-(D/E)XK nuclease family protein [Patescibacteria group bacterium]MBU2543221.1 PD-(D/E)XK nuclease family protein [Patescibacteria group bacterium]